MKKIRISFSEEAKIVFDFLAEKSLSSKKEKMLFSAVQHKIGLIKQDLHYGNPIPKKLIPSFYKEKYEVTSLYRVELPMFWRMIYASKEDSNEIEIIAFILDIFNHSSYDKRFGYKKRK